MDQYAPALELTGVRVEYPGGSGLKDVSLAVRPGEVVALLGPNGAGKTTAVNLICGLLEPDSGEVRLLGASPAGHAGRHGRSRLGVLPQDSTLYPELNAVEHLRLSAALYGLHRPGEKIQSVLGLVDLWDRRHARTSSYSGGMRRRLALARALLHDPAVLVLDEPTLGVDVHGRRALWDRIRTLRDERRAVLLTTNYLEEAASLCDVVVILDEGRVIAAGSPAELQRRMGGYTLALRCTDRIPDLVAALESHPAVNAVVVAGDEVRLTLPDEVAAAEVVALASATAPIEGLRSEQPTLEDVFVALTGDPRD
jgi:ABC-type multidrug transport system ATPase subunit